MSSTQKRTSWVLGVIALAYFCVFLVPNALGAADAHALFVNSQDESFQYPFLLNMVTPGKDIHETMFHIISYGHYIYGYPFYVVSALVALPVRLIYGDGMTAHTGLTLLLLRQFVSVLPMILAILIMVFLQTRFKNTWMAVGTFAFLLTVLGVVRQNIWWWHPDALAILFVALTFLFLELDRLRYGRFFILAAAACGMAVSIKSVGLFFFLVIAGYLIAGLIKRKLSLGKALLLSAVFILIMAATVLITNPLLFKAPQRARIIQVHLEHNYYFTHGWQDDDPYATGFTPWLPILQGWYGRAVFLAFSVLALLAGCVWGGQRRLNSMILSWAAPFAWYIFTFIAVKPDHYWLPVLVPLFSAILAPLLILQEKIRQLPAGSSTRYILFRMLQAACLVVAGAWFVNNLIEAVKLYANVFTS